MFQPLFFSSRLMLEAFSAFICHSTQLRAKLLVTEASERVTPKGGPRDWLGCSLKSQVTGVPWWSSG